MYQPFQLERSSRWTNGMDSSDDCIDDIRDKKYMAYHAMKYV